MISGGRLFRLDLSPKLTGKKYQFVNSFPVIVRNESVTMRAHV